MKKSYLPVLFLLWVCFIPFNLRAQDTSSTQQPVLDCVRVVEKMPTYPGGQSALLKFINDNVQIWTVPMSQLQSSQLVIQFVVERDGSINALKVIKSIHPEVDAAYLRVFEQMPVWEPARQRGMPVRTQMNFPIRIRFE